MVGSVGAQLALLVFAVTIVTGLHAGNSATTILTRALTSMLVAALLGQIVGWMARMVLRDVLQAKKAQIDQAHMTAVAAFSAADDVADAASAVAAPEEASEE